MHPLSGVCIADSAQRDAYCTNRASGACNTCSSAAFLMNGGCYKSEYCPGSAACNAQSGGKCTQAKEGYGMSADGKLQPRGPACLRKRILHQWQRMSALCCCGCKACGNANVCQECGRELVASLDGRSCQGTVAATMCPATRRTAGAWLRPLGLC